MTLLVEMDKRHENLCRHATKKLLELAYLLESN